MFSSQCYNSLVCAARQIENKMSPIAKKFQLCFSALRILSSERLIIQLVLFSSFYAYFEHVLHGSKQVFQTEI